MANREGRAILEGWLQNKLPGINNWRRKYFSFDNVSCVIKRYEDDNKTEEKGSHVEYLVIGVIDIPDRGWMKKSFRFDIESDSDIVSVHCQSEKTKQQWIETIKSAIAARTSGESSSPPPAGDSRRSRFDGNDRASVSSFSAPHVAAGAPPAPAPVPALAQAPAPAPAPVMKQPQLWSLKSSNISKVCSIEKKSRRFLICYPTLAQYQVGTRVSGLGDGQISGYIVSIVPDNKQYAGGPGTINVSSEPALTTQDATPNALTTVGLTHISSTF
jgi:hypothetical protein